jgi:phosphatidylinositol glycan class U
VSDLTPNVGMWWYFFTEMFDHFRLFFLGVFQVGDPETRPNMQLHNLIYVAPLCLRFQHDPLFAVLAIVSIFSTWKSYPTLGDLAVWAGLLACFPEVVSSTFLNRSGPDADLRHPLFTLTVYLYTCMLLPLLHSLWLLTGTGNANFFYAATMVHGLNTCLAIVDVVGGAIRAKVKQAAPASATVVQLNQNA